MSSSGVTSSSECWQIIDQGFCKKNEPTDATKVDESFNNLAAKKNEQLARKIDSHAVRKLPNISLDDTYPSLSFPDKETLASCLKKRLGNLSIYGDTKVSEKLGAHFENTYAGRAQLYKGSRHILPMGVEEGNAHLLALQFTEGLEYCSIEQTNKRRKRSLPMRFIRSIVQPLIKTYEASTQENANGHTS